MDMVALARFTGEVKVASNLGLPFSCNSSKIFSNGWVESFRVVRV